MDSIFFCLVPRALFYELLPVDRTNNDDLSTVLVNELELDKDHEVVITNLSGPYRYRLGDVVKFKGYYMDQMPLGEFQYRIGQLLDLRGDKFCEPQLAAAVRDVDEELRKSGSGGVIEYTSIQSEKGSSCRYIIVLEVDHPIAFFSRSCTRRWTKLFVDRMPCMRLGGRKALSNDAKCILSHKGALKGFGPCVLTKVLHPSNSR